MSGRGLGIVCQPSATCLARRFSRRERLARGDQPGLFPRVPRSIQSLDLWRLLRRSERHLAHRLATASYGLVFLGNIHDRGGPVLAFRKEVVNRRLAAGGLVGGDSPAVGSR